MQESSIQLAWVRLALRGCHMAIQLKSPFRLAAFKDEFSATSGIRRWSVQAPALTRMSGRTYLHCDLNKMIDFSIPGEEVRRRMRKSKISIRALATTLNVPMTRVRHVRTFGVSGYGYCRDWLDAIKNSSD